jgi:glycopeptide antibiotics resistance protein
VKTTRGTSPKMVLVVCLVVPIALLHFFTGSAYGGPWPEFVNGYLLDILVPFAFYFLLVLPETPLLRFWLVKALLVFGAGASVEIAQYFGAPILGRTFDPLDFVMYGLGVGLAALLDTVVFPRLFAFWSPKASASA